MRMKGFIARQNFSCCSNCGGGEITTLAEQQVDKGKDVKGCVFFHRQDSQGWRDGDTLMLRYGQMDSVRHGPIGLPDEEVGNQLAALLTEENVPFLWDGNPRICIEVAPIDWEEGETLPWEARPPG